MAVSKYLNYLNNTCPEIKTWINTNLSNYLSKKEVNENQGEIEHILDYFIARKRKCQERNKSFNLSKMSYNDAKRLSEQWITTLNKQAKDIIETEVDTELAIDFENGMRLVKLVGKSAYQREGKLMSHCVSSYYGKNVEIYSLRDAKNNPHCTMEIVRNSNSINQIKGKGNGSIHPKYINYVIKSLEFFGMDIRKSEFSYLGYKEVSSSLFSMLLTDYKDLKFMSYKGSNFIYIHQNFLK